ncbi:MAG TPA: Fe-S-binding domain-containing protein, partial [Anaerolineae bacterium]
MIISLLLIIPIIGAVLVVLIPRNQKELTRWLALLTALINLGISIPLYLNFDETVTGYQFEEFAAWIPSLNINYHVGLDGLSLFLVLLTTFLTAIAVLSSWTAVTEGVKEYMALLLFLETAMLGVFVS